MKAVVLTFPGSNCDYDLYKAVQQVGGRAEFLWHRAEDRRALEDADAVLLPGGFSYGDYLRAGAIARFSPVMEDVAEFARSGGTVVGICNGFQILCEAGILPGALIRNRDLKFISDSVRIRVERDDTLFTADYDRGDVLRIPLAHAEGNYRADPDTLRHLEDENRVVFRYVDADGEATEEGNPNGSQNNIAGIVNAEGNVLGMMPHPERAMEGILGSTDGFAVFTSLMKGLTPAATR